MPEEPSTTTRQHADSNASRPQLTDLEQKAGEIFVRLSGYVNRVDGYTTLNSFSHAVTFFPTSGFILETQEIHPRRPEEREPLVKYGLTEEQIDQGITIMDRFGMVIPDPNKPFDKFTWDKTKGTRTYIAVVGKDQVKVVDVAAGVPTERQLDLDELSSLAASSDLMKLMMEISATFKDVSQFRGSVKRINPDINVYMGIEDVDTKGLILFNGGLPRFVDEYRSLKSGNPTSDSTGRMIRSYRLIPVIVKL
ncbi:MAG TPA: hypothetical protein VMR81_01695 [Patescibacteria group bacterium]|nr:hypothetical protein [Patescibacteria group bacterium]